MDYLFRDKNTDPTDIKHELFDESTDNFLVSCPRSTLLHLNMNGTFLDSKKPF